MAAPRRKKERRLAALGMTASGEKIFTRRIAVQRSANVCFAELCVGGGVLRDHHVLLGVVGEYAKARAQGLAIRTVLLGLCDRGAAAVFDFGAHAGFSWRGRPAVSGRSGAGFTLQQTFRAAGRRDFQPGKYSSGGCD